MQPSIFNVRVPLADGGDVFLMNTFTDAQLIVSREVSDLLDRLGNGGFANTANAEEREAVHTLAENGFVVESRETDRRNITSYFDSYRTNSDQLRVTVLTTLQCNFACDYCIQGDHGEYNKTAAKMSMETAARARRAGSSGALTRCRPKSFALTFFGGEPLLNLPVVYYLAERVAEICRAADIGLVFNMITNGLLLTPEVVDRLTALAPLGVKVTLDGDRDTHNRMRPLRGGQGTFDRILKNVRAVADRCRVVDRRQLRRVFGRQLSGAARLPARAGLRRQADKDCVQADHPRVEAKGFHPADGGRLGRQATRTARA